MSSNGFNHSPYFGPGEHGNRNQALYRESSNGNEAYQRPTGTPQYSAVHSSNGSLSYAYPRYLEGGGNGPYQLTRATPPSPYSTANLNTYSTAGSSVDTTALGNLAYASSLGRESRDRVSLLRHSPLHQVVDYGRSQPVTSLVPAYKMNFPATVGYDHHGADNNGAGSVRNYHMETQNEYSGSQFNTATIRKDYTQAYSSAEGNHVSSSQATRYDVRPKQPEQQQVTRPSPPVNRQSSPALYVRPSPTNSVANSSTRLPNYRSEILHATSRVTDQTGVEPQQDPHALNPNQHATSWAPVVQDRRSSTVTGAFNSNPQDSHGPTFNDARSHPIHLNKPPPYERPEDHPQIKRLPAISGDRTSYGETHPHQMEASKPTTVDPSQIFNDYEYRRRQAIAIAEAEAARNFTVASKMAVPNEPTNGVEGNDPDARKKDQMELEMKQMIEKMRDYKAKDPTLFSQIWEQVKKVSEGGHFALRGIFRLVCSMQDICIFIFPLTHAFFKFDIGKTRKLQLNLGRDNPQTEPHPKYLLRMELLMVKRLKPLKLGKG